MHLIGVEVDFKETGSVFVNYFFDKGMSYGNLITDKSGKDAFGIKTLESLAVIENIDAFGISPDELEELVLQFKNSNKTVMVIPEFTEIDVVAHVQYKYEKHYQTDGELQERISVKRFYRTSDNASSTEIVEETPTGARFANDTEKYASTVIYDEGVDEAMVTEWKAAKKAERDGAAPVANGGAAKAAGFGNSSKGFGQPSQGQ